MLTSRRSVRQIRTDALGLSFQQATADQPTLPGKAGEQSLLVQVEQAGAHPKHPGHSHAAQLVSRRTEDRVAVQQHTESKQTLLASVQAQEAAQRRQIFPQQRRVVRGCEGFGEQLPLTTQAGQRPSRAEGLVLIDDLPQAQLTGQLIVAEAIALNELHDGHPGRGSWQRPSAGPVGRYPGRAARRPVVGFSKVMRIPPGKQEIEENDVKGAQREAEGFQVLDSCSVSRIAIQSAGQCVSASCSSPGRRRSQACKVPTC